MKFRSGLLLITAAIAIWAELPDVKPIAPLDEIITSTLQSGSSDYQKISSEKYRYTDFNSIDEVTTYDHSREGRETVRYRKRYVYSGEQLDSSIHSMGEGVEYQYSPEGAYWGYTSTTKGAQNGSSTSEFVLSETAEGDPLKKQIVRKIWGRYSSTTDSIVVSYLYNSKGMLLREESYTVRHVSRTGVAGSVEKFVEHLDYEYEGSILIKKSHSRYDGDTPHKDLFTTTAFTTYLKLTGLSGEDVSIEEQFVVNDGVTTPVKRVTESRDEQGRVEEVHKEQYIDSLQEYASIEQSFYSYSDQSGLLVEQITKRFDGELSNTTKKEYLYRDETSVVAHSANSSDKMSVVLKNSTLTFDMVQSGAVSLNVYTIDGRKVMTLFNGRELQQGSYTMNLRPIAQFQSVASGLYIYQLNALGQQFSGKVSLP